MIAEKTRKTESEEMMEKLEKCAENNKYLRVFYVKDGTMRSYDGILKRVIRYRYLEFDNRAIAFLTKGEGIREVFCEGERVYFNPHLVRGSNLEDEIGVKKMRRNFGLV